MILKLCKLLSERHNFKFIQHYCLFVYLAICLYLKVQESENVLCVKERRKLTLFFFLQSYDHLFKVNDKSVGGSFYLQSKVSNSYLIAHKLI